MGDCEGRTPRPVSPSKQAISAKVLLAPVIQDTLEADVWTQFVENSPPVEDLTKLIQGGPNVGRKKLVTAGDIDIQQQPQGGNFGNQPGDSVLGTWRKMDTFPTVLSIDNLSPMLGDAGSADQYIAVLRPLPKTARSAISRWTAERRCFDRALAFQRG